MIARLLAVRLLAVRVLASRVLAGCVLTGCVLAGCVLVTADAAIAQTDPPPVIDPSIGRVEVLLDLPKDVPYVDEMILLRVRSTIRGDVALDQLRQPPFTNFNWQQLGRDKAIRVMADGFNVPGFERDIAIFPLRAGRLIIDPFVRHVTMVVGINQRVETEFASKPIYVDVQRHEGISKAEDWWLPAKAVTIKETWTTRPDAIEPGKVARRLVTVEAVGTTADRLPPPPVIRAPGVITFTGPATRETILTPEGPIARATYQWDVRPVSNSPAKLPAIHVPWFDIGERRMRDVAIADQWIGYIGADAGVKRAIDRSALGQFLASGPLIAGLAGFIWVAALAGLTMSGRSGWRARARRAPALRDLLRAGRRGDASAVKAALMRLARHDPDRWRQVQSDMAVGLARLDAALFGKAEATMPPLKRLAADVAVAWARTRPAPGLDRDDAFMPLDGDHPDGIKPSVRPFSSAR